MQEAIEATVAPAVFHDVSTSIRSTTKRDARKLALVALVLSALLAGALRLTWKPAAPSPARDDVKASASG